MANNVFIEHVKDIVKTSYSGTDTPQFDWQTSVDLYMNEKDITKDLSIDEINRQISEFLKFVANKKFDKNGYEII